MQQLDSLNASLKRKCFIQLSWRHIAEVQQYLAQTPMFDLLFCERKFEIGLIQIVFLAQQLSQLLLSVSAYVYIHIFCCLNYEYKKTISLYMSYSYANTKPNRH